MISAIFISTAERTSHKVAHMKKGLLVGNVWLCYFDAPLHHFNSWGILALVVSKVQYSIMNGNHIWHINLI